MTTKYLLPCECGETLTVDATESGLTRSCKCGAELEVPTLRGLAKLQRAAEDAPAHGFTWGNRQRGVAVGLLIALVGFGLALSQEFSEQITPESFFEEPVLSEDASPHETHAYFQKNVENEGLQIYPRKVRDEYHRERLMERWRKLSAYAVGAVGLVIIGVTFVLTIKRRPAGRPAAPRRPSPPNGVGVTGA